MSIRVAIHGASGRLGSLIQDQAGPMASVIGPEGALPQTDVVIDVSSAAGLAALLLRLDNQPLLIGTTGALPIDAIKAYAQAAPVAIVPNFSVGVPMLLELLAMAVPTLPEGWSIQLSDVHHVHKKDAPSGTAKRIAAAIAAAGGPADVPITSERVGETVGEHTVVLTGPGERVEIKHVATSRAVFAIGALRWAEWLARQPPGLVQP